MAGGRSKGETGHAIQAAARLDHGLLMLLLTHLPELSKTRADEILDRFGKRRRLAHELGLIDDATDADLKTINEIRTIFVHAEVPITFRSRYIVDEAQTFAAWKPRARARRLFDEAVERCERAIEGRREKIVYERSPTP